MTIATDSVAKASDVDIVKTIIQATNILLIVRAIAIVDAFCERRSSGFVFLAVRVQTIAACLLLGSPSESYHTRELKVTFGT